MKKFYFKQLFTVLLLLCSAIASAHDFEVGGIYYNITDAVNKTVAVTYRGSSSSAYNEYTGDVVIPESIVSDGETYRVTSIGGSAFYGCDGLTSIEIPNSVTSIGNYAFYNCSSLTSVVIGNSVTSIGDDAFYGCDGLTSIVVKEGNTVYDSRNNCNAIIETATNTLVTGCKNTIIPNGITSIGYRAFYDCDGLTSIEIPNSVTSIGNYTFYNCSSLTSVVIGNSVTSIGSRVFSGCSSLTSITIPNSVTSIGTYAFYNCSGLTSIEIPNSVTSIGTYAFYNCSGLTSIEIPNSVTSIGNYAFSYCSGLTSIEIPNSVTRIGSYVFNGCSSLTSITIPNSVTSIVSYAFYDCYGLTSIEIPNSVTSIGNYAFEGCYGLKSIVIPNSVTRIGSYVFNGCSSLTSVTSLIPAEYLFAINSKAFQDVDKEACTLYVPYGAKETYAATEGWSEFTNIVEIACGKCGDNATWELADSTLTISGTGDMYDYNSDNYAPWYDYKRAITSVVIESGITSIGDCAFYHCWSLTSIEIPNSVTSLGNGVFYCCSSLESIVIPDGVTSVGDYAFFECNNLASVVIGNSVTSIGDCAFAYCYRLTSIEIPNSVTSIGEYAFNSCSGLTSIEIPNSVTSIGDWAFHFCYGLTSIEIPNSVKSIGEGAFDGCRGLTSVTSLIPAEYLFAINSNVFNNVNKTNCTLYVPVGAKETYAATEGWSEFKNIVELPTTYNLTISAAKYATLYLDYNAVVPEDVRVYYAEKVEGETLLMERITDVIPANTGVIVTGNAGTYTFEESAEAVAAIENNLFQGSVNDSYITPVKGTKYYVLSMVDGVVGMYRDELAGGTFKNNAFKAYLPLNGESLGIFDTTVNAPDVQLSNRYTFNFGGITAVEVVNAEKADGVIYNLNGQRVENPTKGIYIVNGKKVIY